MQLKEEAKDDQLHNSNTKEMDKLMGMFDDEWQQYSRTYGQERGGSPDYESRYDEAEKQMDPELWRR